MRLLGLLPLSKSCSSESTTTNCHSRSGHIKKGARAFNMIMLKANQKVDFLGLFFPLLMKMNTIINTSVMMTFSARNNSIAPSSNGESVVMSTATVRAKAIMIKSAIHIQAKIALG